MPGKLWVSASAQPAISPPPPQGTSASSIRMPRSLVCSAISSPAVPCPAMIRGIVIRSDQRRAGARRDLGADLLAQLARPIVQPDLGAMGAGVLDLDRRGVGRHDDGRGLAQELRRGGHALGVVAGRVGDHGRRVDLADRIVGAAELERPGPLQAFGLEQDTAADALVQHLGFEQRRARRHAPQPLGRGLDVGKGRAGDPAWPWATLIAGVRRHANGRLRAEVTQRRSSAR